MTRSKARQNASNQKHVSTTIWDAIIRFLDLLNDLFKTGNIYGVFILLLFLIVVIILTKQTSDQNHHYILLILNIFSQEKFYLIPIVFLQSFSIAVIVYQYRTYKKEICRLTALRQKLIHGIADGTLQALENHASSNFDLENED